MAYRISAVLGCGLSVQLITAHFVPYMRVRKCGWLSIVSDMERDESLIVAFADELRARRSALELSQEELAHMVGVNRTYMAKLELAQNQPTLTVLQAIANALAVPLLELLSAVAVRQRRRSATTRSRK